VFNCVIFLAGNCPPGAAEVCKHTVAHGVQKKAHTIHSAVSYPVTHPSRNWNIWSEVKQTLLGKLTAENRFPRFCLLDHDL